MQNNHAQAARHSQGDPPDGVQRLELLLRRFSPNEIQCLSLLQLLLRQRPSALDFPLEEPRLQFARWLVEHGQLSEDVAASQEAPASAEAKLDEVRIRGGSPGPSRTLLSAATSDEPPGAQADSTWKIGGVRWLGSLSHAWSALRQRITEVTNFGREVDRSDYGEREGPPWRTQGTDGLNRPRSPGRDPGAIRPHRLRGPRGAARPSSNVPWLWTRFRHDG
jgi:hypothetical protein